MQKLGLPWSAAHKLIRAKSVYILKTDGKVVEKDIAYKLETGDTLSVRDGAMNWLDKPSDYQHPKPVKVSGQLGDFIMFENENIVVLNKPAGVPCQQGTGVKTSSIDQLLNKHIGGEGHLVHRLDSVTTGLMCCAKTKVMAQWLSANMHSIQKRYHALVVGKKIEPKEGQVFQNLENPIEFSLATKDVSS
jgi:23S rRNA-/tRNA-specific pseudouridylate synthase